MHNWRPLHVGQPQKLEAEPQCASRDACSVQNRGQRECRRLPCLLASIFPRGGTGATSRLHASGPASPERHIVTRTRRNAFRRTPAHLQLLEFFHPAKACNLAVLQVQDVRRPIVHACQRRAVTGCSSATCYYIIQSVPSKTWVAYIQHTPRDSHSARMNFRKSERDTTSSPVVTSSISTAFTGRNSCTIICTLRRCPSDTCAA